MSATRNLSRVFFLYRKGSRNETDFFVRMDIADLSTDIGAVADQYTVLGHTSVTVPANLGLLANDIGGMTNTTQTGTFPKANGGQVEIFADGSFTYTSPGPNDPTPPVAGNTDSFSYTLLNRPQMSSANVTLTYERLVWFVDNTFVETEDGSQSAPFNTLDEVELAAGEDETIFIYYGDGTTTRMDTGLVLKVGQNLLGQPAGLFVDVDGLGPGMRVEVEAAAGNRPVLTKLPGTNPVSIREVVQLPFSSTNAIRELAFQPHNGAAIRFPGGFSFKDEPNGSSHDSPAPDASAAQGSPRANKGGLPELEITGVEVYAQTTTSEGIILESFSRGVAITDFFMQGIGGQTRSGLRLDQGFFSAVIDQVEVRDMFRGVFVQGNVFGADATISNVFVSSTINQTRGVEIYDINGLTVFGNNSIETLSGTIMILAGNVIAPGNVTFGQVLGAMAVNFG